MLRVWRHAIFCYDKIWRRAKDMRHYWAEDGARRADTYINITLR